MKDEGWMISTSRHLTEKGSILIEAVFGLSAVLGSVWINLELMKRAQLDLLLHHSAFLAVRAKALGATSSNARAQMRLLFERSWGAAGDRLWRETDYLEEASREGGRIKLHARFPSLWSFKNMKLTKHHFESTRSCLFPFSWDY